MERTDHIDIAALEELAAEGMVSRIPHPRGHLLLWNYTRACQYAGLPVRGPASTRHTGPRPRSCVEDW